MSNLNFWEFIQERINIYTRRQKGDPWPWTDDLILQRYYFCNIFREWDKTTEWFVRNLRSRYEFDKRVIMATVIFRWFNRIETGQTLLENDLYEHWDSVKAKELLRSRVPVVTGAYIIKTPNNMTKLDGVCWCIDQMWEHKQTVEDCIAMYPRSLEWQWRSIQNYPYMGPFMAYEVITDLRHTQYGMHASDIYTWANPGPGAKRGLSYIFPEAVGPRLDLMQKLLYASTTTLPGYHFEMRDIEHALCEYAKYRNAIEGKKLKRVYLYGSVRQKCQPSV
jgi:hypothetical protein